MKFFRSIWTILKSLSRPFETTVVDLETGREVKPVVPIAREQIIGDWEVYEGN